MGSRELVKILESNGWRLDRVKGSYHIFANPKYGNSVTVSHPKKGSRNRACSGNPQASSYQGLKYVVSYRN